MRGGQATVSNSIHKHMMFSVFVAQLLYLIALKARVTLLQNEVCDLLKIVNLSFGLLIATHNAAVSVI